MTCAYRNKCQIKEIANKTKWKKVLVEQISRAYTLSVKWGMLGLLNLSNNLMISDYRLIIK